MRKFRKEIVAGLMVVGLLATAGTAYAANVSVGSKEALADAEYTLEEMLVYAVEDEYMAQAENNVIMEEFGEQRPFSKITLAEEFHISLLLPLLEEYNIAVPEKDWESLVELPATIEESYTISAAAEEENIAMYESFLKKDLPEDVKEVFERLLNSSKNHLRAFQNAADGLCTGYGQGQGRRKGGMNRGQGMGLGRNSSRQGCIYN